MVETDYVITPRNAHGIQIFPLEFPQTRRADVFPSVPDRDLLGMVRVDGRKVSGPDRGKLGVVDRGEAHILCFTGGWLWEATWKEGRIPD